MEFELHELYTICGKRKMDEKIVRPKKTSELGERKGFTNTRAIRNKAIKRMAQKSRSKSLPTITIMPPVQQLPPTYTPIHRMSVDARTDDVDLESIRVRTFSTTMKGLVNYGDFKRQDNPSHSPRRSSVTSVEGPGTARRNTVFSEPTYRRNSAAGGYSYVGTGTLRRGSCMSEREYAKLGHKMSFSLPGSTDFDDILAECPTHHQVVVLGGEGVGKSAIISQFTTSEFLGASDLGTDDLDEETTSISLILNKEESLIDLMEIADIESVKDASQPDVDAYVLVYSCTDRASFKAASEHLVCLKENVRTTRPVVIVGNKVDLARKRQVNTAEGRVLAYSYNCKYIETSVALNHNIDELLVGILSQIRLQQYGQNLQDGSGVDKKKQWHQKGLPQTLKTAIRGVFGKKQNMSSCEKLYEI